MEIIKYSEEYKKDWDDFIDKSKNGLFMFKRDYMEYHSDRFTDFSLLFYEENKLVALLPLSLHDEIVISHGGLTFGGLILSSRAKQVVVNEYLTALIAFLKKEKIQKMIYKCVPHIYFSLPSEEILYSLWRNNARLVRRDISSAINLKDPIKFAKGRKCQVSKAIKSGILVKETTDFETFINLENQVLNNKYGTSAVHSSCELSLLQSRFPYNIKLVGAFYNEEMIAGTVLFIYPQLVHTQYMAASEKGKDLGGLDLVVKHCIELYSADKQYFDFGISTEKQGTFLNEGLINQKEMFGGRGIVHDFYELEIV